MSRSLPASWRLFTRTLALFLLLGVGPTLLIAILFALPVEWQIFQYRTFIGLLLIVATISTLCLAGLVTRLLKHPMNVLLGAQKEIQQENLNVRLADADAGSVEINALFRGFNHMAESVQLASIREKELVEARSFVTLAAQVVHDIRSPLASLRIATAHFERACAADSQYADSTKLLQLGVQRLQTIADELLTARNQQEAPKITAVHEALRELIDEVQRRQRGGLAIRAQFHEAPLRIPVKKIDLQRAVGNLLTNAIEAMNDAGTVQIATAQEGEMVHVTVSDTGPGIPPEYLARVLQGGFTHGKTDGNGVGMTVVRTIVEKSGGRLHATSILGQGTTFVLEFPLVKTGCNP